MPRAEIEEPGDRRKRNESSDALRVTALLLDRRQTNQRAELHDQCDRTDNQIRQPILNDTPHPHPPKLRDCEAALHPDRASESIVGSNQRKIRALAGISSRKTPSNANGRRTSANSCSN